MNYRLCLLLVLITTLAASAQRFRGDENSLGGIPGAVKQVADSIIISTIGPSLFEVTQFSCDKSLVHFSNPGHLAYNSCNVQKKKSKRRRDLLVDFFVLKYELQLTGNTFYQFEVRIDTSLRLMTAVRLPDCINGDACKIVLDSAAAIEAALQSGLAKGLEINARLVYDSVNQAFEWEVRNHLERNPDTGDTIYINSKTGERITSKDSQWRRSISR